MNTGFWRNFTWKKFVINILFVSVYFIAQGIFQRFIDKVDITKPISYLTIAVILFAIFFIAFWITIWNEQKEPKTKQND